MKRQIKKSDLLLVTKELTHFENTGIITIEQKMEMLGIYEVSGGINFIRVVATIGAILVGLGILSFVASNWDAINHLIKLCIIFGALVGTNLVGFKISEDNPKTGRSLIYLGMIIYGAGIFLIGQIYNFGGDFTAAFMLWSIGTVPMAICLKDKYIMLFANILFLVYLLGSLDQSVFPYTGWIGVPVAYVVALKYFGKSRLLLSFANITTLSFIYILLSRLDIKDLYISLIFLLIGLLMYFAKHNLEQNVFRIQGNILFGIVGMILTIPEIWMPIANGYSMRYASIVFSIAFLVFLFFLISKGSRISVAFICAIIFRYYVDTFEFLPKSMFFIIGGLLLLGFGFYFEKMRKTTRLEQLHE